MLFAGEPVRALEVGEKARALADEVGDVRLRASARTPLAHACRERGDLRRSVALFARGDRRCSPATSRAQRLGQAMPPSVYARSMAALCLAELGDFAEAERLGTEARLLTKAEDLPFGFALAHMALGNIYLVQERARGGDADPRAGARGHPRPRHPDSVGDRPARLRAGAVRPARGRAAPCSSGGLQEADRLRFFFGHSQWVAWLAHAHLLAGQMDEARHRADEALRAQPRARPARIRGPGALRPGTDRDARAGRATEAAAPLYRQALALADELGMRPLAARCRTALAQPGG